MMRYALLLLMCLALAATLADCGALSAPGANGSQPGDAPASTSSRAEVNSIATLPTDVSDVADAAATDPSQAMLLSPDLAEITPSTAQSETAQTASTVQTSAPLAPAAPLSSGKVIVVSRARQWLYAYQNGHLVFANAVETGRPQLPTPAGRFSVQRKARNITFRSPWPKGSPYYYYPTHINYALLFKSGGFYLHDAWWHAKFGPGGNVPHKLANGTWETGSHGCVGMLISAAQRLYNWAQVGTPVIVQ